MTNELGFQSSKYDFKSKRIFSKTQKYKYSWKQSPEDVLEKGNS